MYSLDVLIAIFGKGEERSWQGKRWRVNWRGQRPLCLCSPQRFFWGLSRLAQFFLRPLELLKAFFSERSLSGPASTAVNAAKKNPLMWAGARVQGNFLYFSSRRLMVIVSYRQKSKEVLVWGGGENTKWYIFKECLISENSRLAIALNKKEPFKGTNSNLQKKKTQQLNKYWSIKASLLSVFPRNFLIYLVYLKLSNIKIIFYLDPPWKKVSSLSLRLKVNDILSHSISYFYQIENEIDNSTIQSI